VHAECIKLNGAMELAPSMGLCKRIVDLVETGSTLKANGLVEIEEICKVSTRLAVNRSFLKTNSSSIQPWIDKVGQVIND
jgi:ATP phosphoribosyltransferase